MCMYMQLATRAREDEEWMERRLEAERLQQVTPHPTGVPRS